MTSANDNRSSLWDRVAKLFGRPAVRPTAIELQSAYAQSRRDWRDVNGIPRLVARAGRYR